MIDPVATAATVPAIIATINWLKKLGLPPRGALAAAVILGVGLSIATYLWSDAGWYTYASSGLLLGLAAAGVYDLIPGETPRRAINDTNPGPAN